MPFVFGWLLNAIYAAILTVVAPVLVFRRLTRGKYRRGWYEKLTGRLTRKSPEKLCLWFHAVSVGEVLQLKTVLEETARKFPSAEIFITVTTETGFDVARSKYPEHTVSFFPLDFSWAVNNALVAIRPDLIVLVELELWPNFILSAQRRNIPLALINGRISEKSFRGYSRIKWLMRTLLKSFQIIAVQSEVYADRIRMLGGDAADVVVTGNIKFDRIELDREHPRVKELRSVFGIRDSDKVFIAGSTQDPEERYALDAWSGMRSEFPNLRLILVPRHKERFDEVAATVISHGYRLIRRSEVAGDTTTASTSASSFDEQTVCLLDTLGELAWCWGLADIAFVGGSLTNRGGQNMIEPAGYGAAVLFGPNTQNFKDVTEALISIRAARVVSNADELRETIRDLLLHADEVQRMGENARNFVASQQGATRRTLELITKIIPSAGA